MYAGTGLQEEQAMGQADGDKQRGSRFTAKEQQSWQERQRITGSRPRHVLSLETVC